MPVLSHPGLLVLTATIWVTRLASVGTAPGKFLADGSTGIFSAGSRAISSIWKATSAFSRFDWMGC